MILKSLLFLGVLIVLADREQYPYFLASDTEIFRGEH